MIFKIQLGGQIENFSRFYTLYINIKARSKNKSEDSLIKKTKYKIPVTKQTYLNIILWCILIL